MTSSLVDLNRDGKVDLQDLSIFLGELDTIANLFLSNKQSNESMLAFKNLVLPIIDLFSRLNTEGKDSLVELKNDWETFFKMLDEGHTLFKLAEMFQTVIFKTSENLTDIVELINESHDHAKEVSEYIARFKVAAKDAIDEFKEDTAENHEEVKEDFARMKELWENGDKLESTGIFFKDGFEFLGGQTLEFFDLLGDLTKASVVALKKDDLDETVIENDEKIKEDLEAMTVELENARTELVGDLVNTDVETM